MNKKFIDLSIFYRFIYYLSIMYEFNDLETVLLNSPWSIDPNYLKIKETFIDLSNLNRIIDFLSL